MTIAISRIAARQNIPLSPELAEEQARSRLAYFLNGETMMRSGFEIRYSSKTRRPFCNLGISGFPQMTNFVQKLKLIYELKKNKNIHFRNFTSQQINKGKKTK